MVKVPVFPRKQGWFVELVNKLKKEAMVLIFQVLDTQPSTSIPKLKKEAMV